MRHLYVGEIKDSWPTWLGVSLTFVAANYGLAVGFLYIATGVRGYAAGVLTSVNLTQFAFIGGINIFFGVIVGAAVIGASTALVVASRRGAFARLALAGATPSQIVRIVMVQLIVVSLVCAVVGDVIAGFAFPAYVLAESADREIIAPNVGQAWWAYLGASLLCILIAVIGGWKHARAASRIPPVEALRPVRETTVQSRRRAWIGRGIAVAVGLLVVVGAYAGFPGMIETLGPDAGDIAFQLSVLILVTMGFVIAAAGPAALAGFAKAWASLIPSPSGVWHLARTTVRIRADRFARSVTPIMFAVGLIVGMIGIVDSLEASMAAAGRELSLSSSGVWAIFSIVGAPLIIAAAGSVGSLIMMSRQRAAESALASIVGGTPAQRVWMSVFEALLITVTGLLAGAVMGGMAIGFIVYSLQLLLGVAVLSIPFGVLAGVLALSLVIAVAATVLPALPSLRKPAPAVIAALVSE